MALDRRLIPTNLAPTEFQRRAAAAINRPLAFVTFEVGVEVADVIPVTLQVRDRHAEPWRERWLLGVYLSETEGGDRAPADAVTWTTGEVALEIEPNGEWLVRTDGDGAAELEIEMTAGTRFVNAFAAARYDSAEVVWDEVPAVAHEWQFNDAVNSDQLAVYLG